MCASAQLSPCDSEKPPGLRCSPEGPRFLLETSRSRHGSEGLQGFVYMPKPCLGLTSYDINVEVLLANSQKKPIYERRAIASKLLTPVMTSHSFRMPSRPKIRVSVRISLSSRTLRRMHQGLRQRSALHRAPPRVPALRCRATAL